ncbi:lactate utilization protein C [Hymenobacter caeli]|uniref:L-lactate dehydrogenase complex protein LldG n=1 Tax=Hymenobacter caeli TaxID=2735894 RepID=A0ABX2FUX6_9BACT|nr:LUD domain-containing protein [Hymenobacter caeli]NRT20782.1 L-lactate dehydrogenase complex protein LldG [Hymenobacter caeli]
MVPESSAAAARAAVLARIRQGLARPAALPPRPDFAAPVHPPLPADLAVAFAESFVRVGGVFYYCTSVAHFIGQLGAYLREQQIGRLFAWEPALQNMLYQGQVPFVADETEFLPHADASLTTCEALVARTGSLLVAPATPSGRRLSVYPDQHLVLARPGQVVAEIGDALRLLQARYGAALPSMASLTTGPSRTADIEKTLVLGAHGPRQLVLFLLDDDDAEGAWEAESEDVN